MTRKILIIYGCCHALIMFITTLWASNINSILNTGHLFKSPWFIATLVDAYLGFLIVYIWSLYTTKSIIKNITTLIAFICLGNIAIGLLVTYRAFQMSPTSHFIDFLKGDLND